MVRRLRAKAPIGEIMPLVRVPLPCTLRDIYVGEGQDPATAIGVIAGATKPPNDFVTPTYQITQNRTAFAQAAAQRQPLYSKLGILKPGDHPPSAQYVAQLIVTRRANEGTSTSVYVSKGIYETNYTFDQQGYKEAKGDEMMQASLSNLANWLAPWKRADQPRVYFVMPERIADLNKQAEAEHCNDFVLAYDLTLHALQTALDQVAIAAQVTCDSAQHAIDERVTRLRDALPVGLKDVAPKPELCGQKFLDLCKKSKFRDSSNWHSWGLDYLGKNMDPPSVHYLTGGKREENGRVFLQYTEGQAQVGTHTSASIIKF
jgi:hypothetical protein